MSDRPSIDVRGPKTVDRRLPDRRSTINDAVFLPGRGGYIARWLAGAVVVAGLATLVAGEWWPRDREPVRAALSVTETLGGADTAGYARAFASRPFVFPRDWSAHPRFRNEWWYFTSTLQAASGRRFGVELTFFRTAVAPEPPDLRSPWATNQVYMAHLAVTDETGKRFHAFDRFERGALGLAGTRAAPFRVWVRDWVLESDEPAKDAAGTRTQGAESQPADARNAAVAPRRLPRPGRRRTSVVDSGAGGAERPGAARWRSVFPLKLRAGERSTAGEEVAVDLVAGAGKGLVLQGDSGLSRKGPESGNASYYYSLPHMPVWGQVIVDGDTAAVSGSGWLDREWSTSALDDALAGWDWFGLRLDDGRDLMVYRLRRKDGSVDPYSAGVLVGADGRTRRLTADDVRLDVLDTWISPTTGVRYPSLWRLRVPSVGLDLEITPWLRQQELNLTFRYWEGAVDVRTRGSGGVVGRGYVELTGYGASRHENVPIRR